MPKWKEGDRVRVVTRDVTEEDRKKNRYFSHMAGLIGTVQNVYADDQVGIVVDPKSLSDVSADVHRIATERMRTKFIENVSEEQKKSLTKEELEFDTHFVILARGEDLEKA